ncbi:hypothetical protein B0T16DRAFT_440842 [Cercophora newfieldiana]|uniref:Uncharacterized protein n=1 Tax=Cercophora newfieldiana TaxID=92897 RepID=A0AA39YQX9_9PEZI|nr:hypothetical protein B0T16DRAFT_440842 [Cercophora newfieldiana]
MAVAHEVQDNNRPVQSSAPPNTYDDPRYYRYQEPLNPNVEIKRASPHPHLDPPDDGNHDTPKEEPPAEEITNGKQIKRVSGLRRFFRRIRGKPSVTFKAADGGGEGKKKGKKGQGWPRRKPKEVIPKGKEVQTVNPKQTDQLEMPPEGGIFGSAPRRTATRNDPFASQGIRTSAGTNFAPHMMPTGSSNHQYVPPKIKDRVFDDRDPLRSNPVPKDFAYRRSKPRSVLDDASTYELGQPGPSNYRRESTNPYSETKQSKAEQGGDKDEEEQYNTALIATPRSHFEPPPAPDGCTFQEWQQLTGQGVPAVPNRVSSRLPWPSRSRLTMASSRHQKSICPSIASRTSWNPFNLPGPVRVSSFADVLEMIRQRRASNANMNGNVRNIINKSSTNLLNTANANPGIRRVLSKSSVNLLSTNNTLNRDDKKANNSRTSLLEDASRDDNGNDKPPTDDNKSDENESNFVVEDTEPIPTTNVKRTPPKVTRKPLASTRTPPSHGILPPFPADPTLRRSSTPGSIKTLGSTSTGKTFFSGYKSTTTATYTDATNPALTIPTPLSDPMYGKRLGRARDLDSAIDIEDEEESPRRASFGIVTRGGLRTQNTLPRAPKGVRKSLLGPLRRGSAATATTMPDSAGDTPEPDSAEDYSTSTSTEAWWMKLRAARSGGSGGSSAHAAATLKGKRVDKGGTDMGGSERGGGHAFGHRRGDTFGGVAEDEEDEEDGSSVVRP